MTPAERAADTPKRCMQCRGAWAVGTILINGRRQHRCQSCIDARRRVIYAQQRLSLPEQIRAARLVK